MVTFASGLTRWDRRRCLLAASGLVQTSTAEGVSESVNSLNDLQAIIEADDDEQTNRLALAFAVGLGFSGYFFTDKLSLWGPLYWNRRLSSWHHACGRSYIAHRHDQADPIVERLRCGAERFVWSRDLFVTEAERRVFDHYREQGRPSGLALGKRTPFGLSVLLLSSEEILHVDAEVAIKAQLLWHALMENDRWRNVEATERRVGQAVAGLSSEQLAILGWIAAGKSNSVIAEIEQHSRSYVDFHVNEIYARLQVSSREKATMAASISRLISEDAWPKDLHRDRKTG